MQKVSDKISSEHISYSFVTSQCETVKIEIFINLRVCNRSLNQTTLITAAFRSVMAPGYHKYKTTDD